MASRRSYGTGSLIVRTDRAGRETWYGKWRSHGRQVMRRVGLKRAAGSREGLTRTQAEAKLRQLIAESPGGNPTAERLTLAEVAPRYLRHLEAKGRKRSTVVAAESCLGVWLLPALGDKALDAVRGEDVEDLMARMEAGDRPDRPGAQSKPCGPKTIRNYIGTLSAIYRYAMHSRRRWASANPCDDVDLPEVEDNGEIHFFDPDEVDALIRSAEPGEYHELDRLLYRAGERTGLRHGELIAWRWMDLDYLAMRVRVRQNFVLGEFGSPKSRRSSRSLPLDEELAGALERYRKAVAQRLGAEPADDALVFADPITGGPLSKAANNRRFKKTLKRAGLDGERVLHGLRHSFGVRCAAAGVPMRTLQEWMGHRDIATTQRYADYAPSPHEADMIARAFGRATKPSTNLSESETS
jgi:integrase